VVSWFITSFQEYPGVPYFLKKVTFLADEGSQTCVRISFILNALIVGIGVTCAGIDFVNPEAF